MEKAEIYRTLLT